MMDECLVFTPETWQLSLYEDDWIHSKCRWSLQASEVMDVCRLQDQAHLAQQGNDYKNNNYVDVGQVLQVTWQPPQSDIL